MPDEQELVEWARREALWLNAEDHTGADGDGTSYTAKAVEFLRVHAGESSIFFKSAERASKHFAGVAVREVAKCLEGWASFVEDGLAEAPAALRSRVEAATDLMEQVQILLDDGKVHPAAPVMLAGAALEEYLRGLVVAHDLAFKGKPGLATYGAALREANLLTSRDVKDVIALAGTRNDAAHGDFDKIGDDRARLMADQVNLFLRQKTGPS